MEQPAIPNGSAAGTGTGTGRGAKGEGKRRVPTTKELISHYESQGLQTGEASMKVIEDLQSILMRVVSSGGRSRKEKTLGMEISRKVDMVNTRVAVVDMKLDEKPGYAEALGIRVASAAVFRGIENGVWPHVLAGFSQIWKLSGVPPSRLPLSYLPLPVPLFLLH